MSVVPVRHVESIISDLLVVPRQFFDVDFDPCRYDDLDEDVPDVTCGLVHALRSNSTWRERPLVVPVWYTPEDGCPDVFGQPDGCNEWYVEDGHNVGSLVVTACITPSGRVFPYVEGNFSLGDQCVPHPKRVLAVWERAVICYNRSVLDSP